MGTIRIPLRFGGSKGEKVLYALFDSSATLSCISDEFAKEIGNPEKIWKPFVMATSAESHHVKVTKAMRADFFIDDLHLSDEFMIIQGLSEQAIIGVNTLQKWRLKLDFENDRVIIDPKVAIFILKDLKLIA